MRAFFIFFLLFLNTGLAIGQELKECIVPKPDGNNLAIVRASLENLRSQCIPKIKRIDQCLTRANLLTATTSDLLRKFRPQESPTPLLVSALAAGRSYSGAVDYNVWRNFRALELDYYKSLQAIEKFVKDSSPNPSADRQKIRDQIASIDRGYHTGIDLLRSLSTREYALLSFIEQARDDLLKSFEASKAEALWLAGPDCEMARTNIVAARVQASVQEFIADVDKIHAMVQSARSKRENLIKFAYAAVRSDLEDAYRLSLKRDLSGLSGKIAAIIHVHRLSTSFELWFTSISEDRDRNHLETTYLQFESSRRLYAADLIAAKDFRDRIRLVSGSYTDVGKPYLERLDSVINNLKSKVDRVEAKGWKGFLSSQKMLASRRLDIAEKYTPACVARLQNYIRRAERVQTVESYRSVEGLYMNATKNCMVKI